MRLINAESFPTVLREMMTEIDKNRGLPEADWFLYGFDEFVIALDVIDLVRDMPTVEAIPIEYIKRFATFSPPIPTYTHGEENINMDAWCEELLEHWRKENEKV